LTDDEFVVLNAFYEDGVPESLPYLRMLARTDQDERAPLGDERVARLRDAVVGLLDKGLVDIQENRDFNPWPPRRLRSAEVQEVLRQEQSWLVPGEHGFDGSRDFYQVAPNELAYQAYEAALAQTGRPFDPSLIID
jgi:hypothetical protein